MTVQSMLATAVFSLIWLLPGYKDEDVNGEDPFRKITMCELPKGCVFKTLFEDELDLAATETLDNATSVGKGAAWLVKAQQTNGGWGAGSHYQQNVLDPQAVSTDPATTAMAAMALRNAGSTLSAGMYRDQLMKATIYLLTAVESASAASATITEQTGTQIQVKLGGNIDAILTLQYLSNIVDEVSDSLLKQRVQNAMNVCSQKIQRNQAGDGSMNGAGWAGVLQSSLATNALESALAKGAAVDEDNLELSRKYQKSNYDVSSGNVRTDMGAGIVLYSVSGSARATAKDARKVKQDMEKAIQEGRVEEDAEVTPEVLQEIGFTAEEASAYASSYQVYAASKSVAQDDQVMAGFGNNGGEEFLSYLQTGESLIISNDEGWREWHKSMSDKMNAIQNADGSWNGHHCITSPVFCTATALLILSINNDVERLQAVTNR